MLQGHKLCQKVFQIIGCENDFSLKALSQKILDQSSVFLTLTILPGRVRVDDYLQKCQRALLIEQGLHETLDRRQYS